MPEIFPVFFVGFVVLIVVIAYFSAQAKKKRQEALASLAQQLGLAYYPEGLMGQPAHGFLETLGHLFAPTPDAVFIQRFGPMYPFGRGEQPDVDNLLVGNRNGLDCYLFDYSYKTTSTNSEGRTETTTHSAGIVAVRVPIALPGLSLSAENVFHRIGHTFGLQELNFELEEFNRRYFVQSGDKKAAYDLLHPQAIEYLMRLPVRHWQFGGVYILIAQAGSYRPEELIGILQEIEGFVKLIPAYYRQDHGFTPNWRHPLD